MDPLRALNVGNPGRRRNNTTIEFFVEYLFLEDKPLRREILSRGKPEPLEWLDLQAETRILTKDIVAKWIS